MKKLLLSLLCLLSAAIPALAEDLQSYTISFMTASTDGSTELKTTTLTSDYITSGAEYISGVSAASKVYIKCKNGLKFSSSSASGSASWNLSESGKVNATKIVVKAASYSTGSSAGKFSVNNSAEQTLSSTDLADYTFELNGSSLESISISATNRLYVASITVFYTSGESTVVSTPVIEPGSKYFSQPFTAYITTSTSDASIYYTINGEEPSESSTLYTSAGVEIPAETTILKAIAVKTGLTSSNIVTAEYNYITPADVTINLTNKWTPVIPPSYSETESKHTDDGQEITISNVHTQSPGVILKSGSGYILLPSYDKKIESISLYSQAGASGKATVQIFEGVTSLGTVSLSNIDNSTPHTLTIPEDSQKANVQYKIQATDAANVQLSKIEIRFVDEPEPAVAPTWQLDGEDVTGKVVAVNYNTAGEYEFPTLNNPSGLEVTYSASTGTGNWSNYITLDASTGTITIIKPNNTEQQRPVIKASWDGGSASFTLQINKISFDDVHFDGYSTEVPFEYTVGVTTTPFPAILGEPANEIDLFRSAASFIYSDTFVASVTKDGVINFNGKPGTNVIGLQVGSTATYVAGNVWSDLITLIVKLSEPVIKVTDKDGKEISDESTVSTANGPYTISIQNRNNNGVYNNTLLSLIGDLGGEDVYEEDLNVLTWTAENTYNTPGLYSIMATIRGTQDPLGENATEAYFSFTIEGESSSNISWSADKASIMYTSASELQGLPTLNNPDKVAVTYASSNTAVATIDESTGAITLKQPGSTTISATAGGTTVSYDLTVTKIKFTVTFEGLDADGKFTYTLPADPTYPIMLGENDIPKMIVEPAADADRFSRTYSNDNTAVATMSSSGLMIWGPGETSFSMYNLTGGTYMEAGRWEGYTIVVKPASPTVQLTAPQITVFTGSYDTVSDGDSVPQSDGPFSVMVSNSNTGTVMDAYVFNDEGDDVLSIEDYKYDYWMPEETLSEPGEYTIWVEVTDPNNNKVEAEFTFTIEAAASFVAPTVTVTTKDGSQVEYNMDDPWNIPEVAADNVPVSVVISNPNGGDTYLDFTIVKAPSLEEFESSSKLLEDVSHMTEATWSPATPYSDPGFYYIDVTIEGTDLEVPQVLFMFTIQSDEPSVVDYEAPTVKFWDANDEEVTSGSAAAPIVFSVTNSASQADIYYYIGEDEVTEDTIYLKGDDKFMVEIDLNEPGTYYYSTYVASYDDDTLTGISEKVNGTFVLTNYLPVAATFAVTDNTGATVADGASVAEANAPVKIVVTNPNNNQRFPTSMNITVVNTSNNQSEEYTTPNASYDFYVNASGVYEVTVVVSQEDTKVSSSFGFTIEGDVAYTVLPAYVKFLDSEGNEVASPASVLPITMVIGNENDFEGLTVTMTYTIDNEEFTTTESEVEIQITEPGTFDYTVVCSVNSKSESPAVGGTFTVTADAVKLAEPVITFSNVTEENTDFVTAVEVTITNPNIDGVGTIMYCIDGETWTAGEGAKVTFTIDEDGEYTIQAYVRNDSNEDLSSDTVTEIYTFTGVESLYFGTEGVKVIGGHIVVPEGAEVFTISGVRVNTLDRVANGIYIVRLANGASLKVVVR